MGEIRIVGPGKTRGYPYPWISLSGMQEKCLSSDVAANQWITLYHKNHMTTCVISLWREEVTSLTTSLSTMCFLVNMFNLKAIKSNFKGHIINRILHSWSFHMKFMKLAQGLFHKFLMK